MPTSTVPSRPARRRCNIASNRVTHNASSAGSFHGTILGPPVRDGMLCKTPSWPKGRFHAKINLRPQERGTKVFSESAVAQVKYQKRENRQGLYSLTRT